VRCRHFGAAARARRPSVARPEPPLTLGLAQGAVL